MGVIIIVVGIVYLVIALFVLRFAYVAADTVIGKCLALFIALILICWYPVINPLLSYYSFLSYAKEHAKTKIFKTVSNVKSVALESPFTENIAACERHNTIAETKADKRRYYDYVEYVSENGSVTAVYSDGTHKKYVGQLSQYSVRYYKDVETDEYTVYAVEIKEVNGDVMAISRQALWHGGHWMRIATDDPVPIYKGIPEDVDYAKFVQSVLKPYQL